MRQIVRAIKTAWRRLTCRNGWLWNIHLLLLQQQWPPRGSRIN